MIFEKGNMWDVYEETDLFCITTNSTLNKKGELVMGKGIALQAKQRFPDLPRMAGRLIVSETVYGLMVCHMPVTPIGLFQTKIHWRNPSLPSVIEISVNNLISYIKVRPDWKRIDLNFPGVNNGKLKKELVMPIIEKLPDVVHVWEYE
jgi:hypothetical protein